MPLDTSVFSGGGRDFRSEKLRLMLFGVFRCLAFVVASQFGRGWVDLDGIESDFTWVFGVLGFELHVKTRSSFCCCMVFHYVSTILPVRNDDGMLT